MVELKVNPFSGGSLLLLGTSDLSHLQHLSVEGVQVNKRKGEEYQLFWSEQPDFVRLAAKMNALVIPFASVGGDEAFDLALDSEEVLRTPMLGDLMRVAFARAAPELDLSESVPPITRLPGTPFPSLLPVPNFSRLYFRYAGLCQSCENGLPVSPFSLMLDERKQQVGPAHCPEGHNRLPRQSRGLNLHMQ